MTLTDLGVTNFHSKLDDLRRAGRNLADLASDLDAAMQRAASDPASQGASAAARAAMASIAETFTTRFGPGNDPQLGFEVLLDRLDQLDRRLGQPSADGLDRPASPHRGALPTGARTPPGFQTSGAIESRDDVARALDLVLDYYKTNEPSSPVPLLIQRAKRLVSMSFMDALRDLAPAGMKELQAIAGVADEKK
jgi:type VI secretion system protein ImpA